MIAHKITPGTPDEICEQCDQCYQEECRAMMVPHSDMERAARTTGYGMECDDSHLKGLRHRRFGVRYHTPEGRYE